MPEVSTGLLMEIVQYLDNDCINNRTKGQELVDRIMEILQPYE